MVGKLPLDPLQVFSSLQTSYSSDLKSLRLIQGPVALDLPISTSIYPFNDTISPMSNEKRERFRISLYILNQRAFKDASMNVC